MPIARGLSHGGAGRPSPAPEHADQPFARAGEPSEPAIARVAAPPLGHTCIVEDLDRYSFDTTGYLVVENALSREQVQHMRAVIKEHGVEGGPTVEEQRFGWHGELLTWDQAFRDVIDHPVVLDALAAFIGPQVRLDNAYGIVMEPGTEGVGLHGPAQPYDPAQYFRHEAGITRTGMLGFGWALDDTPDDGGGFGCIAGSHLISTPPPAGAENLVHPVRQQAGSLLIFTEALWHRTMPWNGRSRRLALFYKYAAGTIQFDAAPALPAQQEDLLSERQRLLVRPPSRIARPDAL